MPTAYVYAPLSGPVTQGATPGHTPCTDGCSYSTCKPVDIAPAAGTAIKLWVNYPTVQSILYSITTGDPFECCDGLDLADDTLENNLKRAIRVSLYAYPNYCCFIGTVLFGHINQSGFSLVSGNISGSYCGQLGTVINANGQGCYSGPHLHMECDSAGTLLRSAGVNVTAQTDTLFSWGVSGCYCP